MTQECNLRRFHALGLILLSIACGPTATSSEGPPSSESPGAEEREAAEAEGSSETSGLEAETSDEPVEVAPFEVHEWGLVDLGPENFELAAGPGFHFPSTTATSPTPPRPTPVPTRPGVRRKPVIYIHLGTNEPIDFSLSVTAAGSIAEHWPPTRHVGSTLVWAAHAAPGTCANQPGNVNRYPLRDSEACRAAPDGYCELADLHRYETNDGACLTVEGGQTWDHLFYRSAGVGMQSAVAVERVNGAWQATNRSLQAPVGGLYYIHRSPVGAQTPTVAARIDVPAVGQSAVFPAANSATTAAIRSELSGLLRSGGLSEDEAMAFEGAWFAELFENGHTGGAPLVEDAVLYVMPLADVDQVSQLEFRPMPSAIRRVFWMRIIL